MRFAFVFRGDGLFPAVDSEVGTETTSPQPGHFSRLPAAESLIRNDAWQDVHVI